MTIKTNPIRHRVHTGAVGRGRRPHGRLQRVAGGVARRRRGDRLGPLPAEGARPARGPPAPARLDGRGAPADPARRRAAVPRRPRHAAGARQGLRRREPRRPRLRALRALGHGASAPRGGRSRARLEPQVCRARASRLVLRDGLGDHLALLRRSAVAYSFYWSARPWGVCACGRESEVDGELGAEDDEDHSCPGRRRAALAADDAATSAVGVQPAGGNVAPRSSCAVRVSVADVGDTLGTRRAVLMCVSPPPRAEPHPGGA